jgi:dolichol-phosphate mannosyltransferase
MISIVIPTYQEADVVETTLRRAAAALTRTGDDFELIVVDDTGPGGDGTADRAEALAPELPVRVIRRPRRLGLGTAVTDGWRVARGEILGAMDADLQHPPEVLVRLAQAMRRPTVDVAIASRYVEGGLSPSWPRRRRLASRLSTHLAALVLPRSLAGVHDPMSGMFFVRSSAIKGIELRPLGYKILLEVLGRGRWRGFAEVPYCFEPRGFGRSKLGWRQSVEYFAHLARLARGTGQLRTWIRYALVGLSGALLDVAIFQLLVRSGNWSPLAALPAAIELALLSNFAWNRGLTFSPGADGAREPASHGVIRTLGRYQRVCLVGALWNASATLLGLAGGLALALAAAIGVVAGGAWNLLFNVPRIWQAFERASRGREADRVPLSLRSGAAAEPRSRREPEKVGH